MGKDTTATASGISYNFSSTDYSSIGFGETGAFGNIQNTEGFSTPDGTIAVEILNTRDSVDINYAGGNLIAVA